MRPADRHAARLPAGLAAALALAAVPAAGRVLEFVQTAEGSRLTSAERVAVSPDGRHLYVGGSEGLEVFARDPASGKLRFVVREEELRDDFVLSPDGRHLYARENGRLIDRLNVYERDPASGRLRFAGSPELSYEQPRDLAFSPDGRHLYTAGRGAAVYVLARDDATGDLRETGRLPASDGFGGGIVHAASPDGRNLYAADLETVTVLARDPASGALTFVESLAAGAGVETGVNSLAVSPDGRHLYAAVFGSDDAIEVFEREPARGALRRVDDGFDGGGLRLLGARQLAVGPGGGAVYLAASRAHAVVAFARDPASGALAFAAAVIDGEDGADGLETATGVAVSPDGEHVYAAGLRDHAVAQLAAGEDGGLSFVEARFPGDDGFAGLGGVRATAVSPDGEHLYAVAFHDRTIAAFARRGDRGTLAPIATYELDPDVAGPQATALALDPDGLHLYATRSSGRSLLGFLDIFARDPADGTLAHLETRDQTDEGFSGLIGADSVIVSPDGRHVVVGGGHGLLVLERDEALGTVDAVERLLLGGSIDDTLALAASPDGRHLYATSRVLSSLTALARDADDGTLDVLATYSGPGGTRGLDGATAVAVSDDGRHVYAASLWEGVAAFDRDAASGELSLRAVYADGEPGLEGLAGARDVAVGPGGGLVYVAGSFDHSAAVLGRDPESGRLELLEVHRDAFLGVDGLRRTDSVTVSPDGRNAYLTSLTESAIAVFRRAGGPCAGGAGTRCLGGNRFRVVVGWRDSSGARGAARAAPIGSDDSGLFWFFHPDNWEVLVKVLDGCAINDRFWVFAAAATDVAYTLRVTDELSGATRVYANPLGRASPAITDTDAFATCRAARAGGARHDFAPPLPASTAGAGGGGVAPRSHPLPHDGGGGSLLVGLGGRCLDVQGTGVEGVTPVNVYRCHGRPSQRWELVETGARLEVRGLGGRRLRAGDDAGPRRGRAGAGTCGEDARWELEGDRGAFRLVHVASGRCLGVEGAETADRAPVQLFECRDGAHQTWRAEEVFCRESPSRLCLGRGFEVEVEWRDVAGDAGRGHAVPFAASDSGLFWFFSEANWELLVKVLDGCGLNGHYWVFTAAATDAAYTLRVTDTRTGATREYANPLGSAAAAVTDTAAFATCP